MSVNCDFCEWFRILGFSSFRVQRLENGTCKTFHSSLYVSPRLVGTTGFISTSSYNVSTVSSVGAREMRVAASVRHGVVQLG